MASKEGGSILRVWGSSKSSGLVSWILGGSFQVDATLPATLMGSDMPIFLEISPETGSCKEALTQRFNSILTQRQYSAIVPARSILYTVPCSNWCRHLNVWTSKRQEIPSQFQQYVCFWSLAFPKKNQKHPWWWFKPRPNLIPNHKWRTHRLTVANVVNVDSTSLQPYNLQARDVSLTSRGRDGNKHLIITTGRKKTGAGKIDPLILGPDFFSISSRKNACEFIYFWRQFHHIFRWEKPTISQVSSVSKACRFRYKKKIQVGEEKKPAMTPSLLGNSQLIGFFPQLFLKDFPVVLFQRFFKCDVTKRKKCWLIYTFKVYDCNFKISGGNFALGSCMEFQRQYHGSRALDSMLENSHPSQVLLAAASSFTLRRAFCTTCERQFSSERNPGSLVFLKGIYV